MTPELRETLTALSARLQTVNDLDLVAGRIRKAAETREKLAERGASEAEWTALESLFRLARVLDRAADDLACADKLLDAFLASAPVTPAAEAAA